MFKERVLTTADYSTLSKWWKDWGWEVPPKDFLPENGTGGIMVEKEGEPICAGFIYFTNSKICWSEFVISNMKASGKDRGLGVKKLLTAINDIARNKGFKYVYTIVADGSLYNTYKKLGFMDGSKNMNELVLKL